MARRRVAGGDDDVGMWHGAVTKNLNGSAFLFKRLLETIGDVGFLSFFNDYWKNNKTRSFGLFFDINGD
jgi:hypothetical protein